MTEPVPIIQRGILRSARACEMLSDMTATPRKRFCVECRHPAAFPNGPETQYPNVAV
jgi:hypothetical protein